MSIVSKVILQLTTNVFEEKHLQHLSNRLTGCSSATALQVFQHLYRTYDNISELYLLRDQEKIKTQWNQEESIKIFF